jgi:transposase
MSKGITLPVGLTLKDIQDAKKIALDASGKKWLKALKLALAGGMTAEAIAARVRRSRRWLFARRKKLKQNLAASLSRGAGGGRKSLISSGVEAEIKKLFRPGDSSAKIHNWLKNKRNIHATIEQVYRLRQRLGFAKKQTGRSRRKEPAAPRPDPLFVNIDTTTMDMIAFMLHGPHLAEGKVPKMLGILWILGWRARICSQAAKGKNPKAKARALIPEGRYVARNLECSPKLLYRVAQLWTQAKSNWGAFVKSAFSSLNQRNIRNAERAFLNQSPQPAWETNITIKIRDDCEVLFENGRFTRFERAGG